jgi:hypothetical protein
MCLRERGGRACPAASPAPMRDTATGEPLRPRRPNTLSFSRRTYGGKTRLGVKSSEGVSGEGCAVMPLGGYVLLFTGRGLAVSTLWGAMRSALLTASAVVAVLAGCGGTGASEQLPKGVDHKLYVICSGKPRYCAVADLRAPHPHWTSASELAPREARRFRRLVPIGSVPLP